MLHQLQQALVWNELGLPGPQDVGVEAAGVAFAKDVPHVRVRKVFVDLVDVVGEVDELPLLVVEGDEEVVRVHQLADDGVHLR